MSEFKNKIKAVSLFSNVGIAETYFNEVGVSVAVANEFTVSFPWFPFTIEPDAVATYTEFVCKLCDIWS